VYREAFMRAFQQDYSVFKKFNFQYQPVGIKYLLNRPKGLDKLEKSIPICRMFCEAQSSRPFYAAAENFSCVDRLLLGMMDPEPIYESGQIGATEKIYQEARANRRIYRYAPKLGRGTVRYVAFSPLDKMSFEPDLLVITADTSQAEILFRAASYSIGKPLSAKYTPVLSCAWIFIHPYVSGNLNYTVTGLGYGIRLQKLLPEGLILISVPYDLLPMLMSNLKEMEWVLPMTTMGEEERKKFAAEIMEQIRREYAEG
jgi:uncharacterized protein (DUF169 family)